MANGQLPLSALDPIPGSSPRAGGHPLLRQDAARAFNALHIYAMERWGISMALSEGAVRRAYRELAAQFLAKRIYGSNAATPGTSNHGLAINVDLMTMQQRWVIDQVGGQFGFSKRCSDAQWEWWHITFCCATDSTRRKVNEVLRRAQRSRTIRRGADGKIVGNLQWHLRRHGYDEVPKAGADGHRHFGRRTEEAVVNFQRRAGLKPDGVVGLRTWRAIRHHREGT